MTEDSRNSLQQILFSIIASALFVTATGCVHTVDPLPAPLVSGSGDRPYTNAAPSAGARKSNWKPWYTTFGDKYLCQLVEESLRRNPDVRAVGERIDQANTLVMQAGSTLFPQVDASGSFRQSRGLDGNSSQSSSLGFLLDWELDFWGRIRSGRSAREQEAVAAVDDWLAARLFLSTSVAETWFSLIEQRGQLQLTNEQIEVNRTLLDLTRLRFGQGQGSSVDVLQQQQQLRATEALVPDIEARIEELALALEALTGRVPGTGKLSALSTVQSPPALPDPGVPADLLCNRPDLRAQQARIVALDHEVGEAIADRLPRFTIGGSAALAGTPTPENLIGEAVAGAVGPLLDGGRRRAEVERRKSRVREEAGIYTALYLDAIRETETALSREQKTAERLHRQLSQLTVARKLLTETRNRYTLGATDYLPVLDALSRVQQLERDILQSRRELLSARIALHRAIGGPMAKQAP